MKENQPLLKQYNEEEIRKLLNDKVKLVYVDTGMEEIVVRYEDIPDVIVDINDKLGSTDLKIYDFESSIFEPMITTFGPFLNRCDPNVRKDIIDRLVCLQQKEESIKDYKVIDEDMLDDIRIAMEQEEMER